MSFRSVLAVGLCVAGVLSAADVPHLRTRTAVEKPGLEEHAESHYYWKTNSVGGTAQLLTLFCRACGTRLESQDVPLLAVLRDTLGDNDPRNDRVTDVWLLTYSRPGIGKRLLAAVPFFYWRVGSGSDKPSSDPKPLMDLNAPQHPMLRQLERDILQWAVFDPMTMGVRATSRAYRENARDYERLHLEEAIGYLREAPASDGSRALTKAQIDTVLARLELRKRLLGGLVSGALAEHLGKQDGFEQQRVRSHNWELLRECADRTGLFFQPLSLAGGKAQYAILWFPLGSTFHSSTSLNSVWNVLRIKNPWTDGRLKDWHGPVFARVLDSHGALVSPGHSGRALALVPLAVYGLNYPKNPLLLVDFRNERHVRRHEVMQRAVNQITMGFLGLSHFTNWYYFLAADLYEFAAKRHGNPINQAERLDCYAEFRVQLALDRKLDPELKSQIRQRFETLAINPLSAKPQREFKAAQKRYARLVYGSDDKGVVVARLNKQRRAEIAAFRESEAGRLRDSFLHTLTFGLYTRAVRRDPANLARLDIERRVANQLNFLDSLLDAGTPPEVACDASRIRDSIEELRNLMPFVQSSKVENHARETLTKLDGLSASSDIKADAELALASFGHEARPYRGSIPGVAAAAAVIK